MQIMSSRFDVVLLLFTASPQFVSSHYVSNNEVWFLPADMLFSSRYLSNDKVWFLPADLLRTECGRTRGRAHKCTPPRFLTKRSSPLLSMLWMVLSAVLGLMIIRRLSVGSSSSRSSSVEVKKAITEAVEETVAEAEDTQWLQARRMEPIAEVDETEWLQAAEAELVRSGQGWFISWRRRLEAAEAALALRTAELAAERAEAVVTVVEAVVEAVVVAAAKEALLKAGKAVKAVLDAAEEIKAEEIKAEEIKACEVKACEITAKAGGESAVDRGEVEGDKTAEASSSPPDLLQAVAVAPVGALCAAAKASKDGDDLSDLSDGCLSPLTAGRDRSGRAAQAMSGGSAPRNFQSAMAAFDDVMAEVLADAAAEPPELAQLAAEKAFWGEGRNQGVPPLPLPTPLLPMST